MRCQLCFRVIEQNHQTADMVREVPVVSGADVHAKCAIEAYFANGTYPVRLQTPAWVA